MKEEPIFIVGAHKSGTTLLRCLMDNHPQLFAIPFETHPFQILGRWILYEYRKQEPITITKNEILKRAQQWIQKNNRRQEIMGDGFVKGHLDEELFDKTFSRKLSTQINPKSILSAYFSSIYQAVTSKENSNTKRYVEKSVDNVEYAIDLAKYFPDAKFIHLVRNPYANVVSLRKFKSRNFGAPLFFRLLDTLKTSYYFLHRNSNLITHYKIITYEELVMHPEKVIPTLCSFLNIKEDELLYQPTLLGKPWRGNSSRGEKHNKISSSSVDRFKNEIHPIEVYYVNRLFNSVIDRYDYEKIPYTGGFWKPLRGENMVRYLANRLYKYYLIEE